MKNGILVLLNVNDLRSTPTLVNFCRQHKLLHCCYLGGRDNVGGEKR